MRTAHRRSAADAVETRAAAPACCGGSFVGEKGEKDIIRRASSFFFKIYISE